MFPAFRAVLNHLHSVRVEQVKRRLLQELACQRRSSTVWQSSSTFLEDLGIDREHSSSGTCRARSARSSCWCSMALIVINQST